MHYQNSTLFKVWTFFLNNATCWFMVIRMHNANGWLGVRELLAAVIMHNYGLLLLIFSIGFAYSTSSLVYFY